MQLIEIPTDAEINDNVVAYWRPRAAAGRANTAVGLPAVLVLDAAGRPHLAIVAETRVGRGSAAASGASSSISPATASAGLRIAAGTKPIVWAGPGRVRACACALSGHARLRVGFELDPGNEAISEMRLVLEAAGKPLSETWLYRWTA